MLTADSSPASSTSSTPTPDRQPPSGPKVWRENQSRGFVHVKLQQQQQQQPQQQNTNGFVPKSNPNSANFQLRNVNNRHPPFQPFRSATPPPPQRPPPWRNGDPIVFSNNATLHQQQQRKFTHSAPTRIRKDNNLAAPAGSPVAEMADMNLNGNTKVPSASTADKNPLDPQYTQQTDLPRRARLRQLGGAVNKNLIQLQTEMGMLSFPRGPIDAPERKALYDLLSDMQRCANNVAETTQRLMKNITIDDSEPTPEATPEPEVKPASPEEEQPYTPLTFQIPPDVLELKRKMEEETEGKYWSHAYYLNDAKKTVTVHYCRTIEECEKLLPQYLEERVIGFDMEWAENDKTGSARKNISMIQVASESTITLIHLAQFLTGTTHPHLDTADQLISPTLHKIITSPDILKVGVNIAGDARRVRNFLGINPQGIFELSDLHHTVVCAQEHRTKIPRSLISLARLTMMHLELPLDKGPVRRSNWSLPITNKQAEYAAADAYAGLRIFDALERQRFQLVPRPKLPSCRIIEEEEEYRPKTPPIVEETPPTTEETSETTCTITTKTKKIRDPNAPVTPRRSSSNEIKLTDPPQLVAAKQFAANYKLANPACVTGYAGLRVWYLWSKEEMGVKAISTMCDIKDITAISYITSVIKEEKCAYDKARFERECMALNLPWITMGRARPLFPEGTSSEATATDGSVAAAAAPAPVGTELAEEQGLAV